MRNQEQNHLDDVDKVLAVKQVPPNTNAPSPTGSVLRVDLSNELGSSPSFDFNESFFHEIFPSMIKRILRNIKRGSLVRRFERAGNCFKNDVPKKEAKQQGNNSTFTVNAA